MANQDYVSINVYKMLIMRRQVKKVKYTTILILNSCLVLLQEWIYGLFNKIS